MKERPILFSGPMVRALLDGRKTQTRRVMRCQPTFNADRQAWEYQSPKCSASWSGSRPLACGKLIAQDDCPYGVRGARLWVREKHHICPHCETGLVAYGAGGWMRLPSGASDDAGDRDFVDERPLRPKCAAHGWRSSIYMPRWASRLTLEVTEVRVERVHDISEADAQAEGAELVNGHPERGAWFGAGPSYREGFAQLWMDINGAESWAANPWVWVVSFRKLAGVVL